MSHTIWRFFIETFCSGGLLAGVARVLEAPCYLKPSSADGLDYFTVGTLLQDSPNGRMGKVGASPNSGTPTWPRNRSYFYS